jgi:mRNA-degrading endonuclease toxin of MazEF toxin-antitoxin module
VPVPEPFPGLVIHYSYLWHDQHRRGLEEGVKERPCVIVSVTADEGGSLIVHLAPVTHQPSRVPSQAVELPPPVKKHLGLDNLRSWVLVTEVNRLRWPGPDVRQIPGRPLGSFSYGVLPPGLFRQVRDALLAAAKSGQLRPTPR